MTTLIEKAQAFAHKAHDTINQKRKYSGEPYWVHTDAVAALVATVTDDENMIAAAHLHDVVEDVFPILPQYSLDAIRNEFGSDVAKLVDALTDKFTKQAYPKLNRKARHHLENKRLALVDVRAKTIKLADLIHNTDSIVKNDKDFANVYLREKLEVLPLISEGSPILLNRASQQVVDGMRELGLTLPMVSS